MPKKNSGARRIVHILPTPLTDSRGNRHDVRYEEDVPIRLRRFTHLDSCWCRSQAAIA